MPTAAQRAHCPCKLRSLLHSTSIRTACAQAPCKLAHYCTQHTSCPYTGSINYDEMEATYRISRRIEGEERALDAVSCVFTSTQQEVAEQWGTYDG